MYKRRTVSAIRDFPPGCRPFPPRFDLQPNGYPVVPSDHVDGPPLTDEEPAPKQLVDMEDEGLTKIAETVKFDPSGEMGSSPMAATRSYPPRGRVSAIRDFPTLCGPSVSKDENKSVGQQNLAVAADESNPLKMVVVAGDVKEVEENGQGQDEDNCQGWLVDMVGYDFDGNVAEEVKRPDEFGPSSEMELPLESRREESNHHLVEIDSNTVINEEIGEALQREGISGKEIIVHPGVQSFGTKPLRGKKVASDRKVVLGLMSEPECPWRHGKGSSKFNSIAITNQKKGKKADSCAKSYKSRAATKTKDSPSHSKKESLKKEKGIAASHCMDQQLVIWEKEDSLYLNEYMKEFCSVQEAYGSDVNVPPIGHGNLSGHDNDSNVTRTRVRETLRLFQAVCRKLLKEEAKLKGKGNARIDLQAAKILKEKGKYVNKGKPIFGSVPGIQVGDEFQYWVELNIVGLHRQILGGIDYVKHNGEPLATSVVASEAYADELDNPDVLVYTGQGGNVINTDKEPKDQKLERGNLALKNSGEKKNPVRVIFRSESRYGSCKIYAYYGLYEVETYWQDMGPHGKLVFKFQLRRIPGQPELAWKELKKSQKLKMREGQCVDDISYEKEPIPICAINTIDDEKPPLFEYISSMKYPDWCNPIPPVGCDCTNGCSDSEKCYCAAKNGGVIPYNHDGAIVEAKTVVSECGPSCKCPSTCYNRVSQYGIKFQLEIFKTRTKGWGVRSLNSIPSGSFICEYTGELLEDMEAEKRTSNDEYLFDIGNNHGNDTLWDELSTIMPDAESSSSHDFQDSCFTIDAAHYGNVGRFINHSCSPNLFAQNVLYDHEDKTIPHIMLFAAENIPPLQELNYHYNYKIDQVYDSDGNIKKKKCLCGSLGCTGRMY